MSELPENPRASGSSTKIVLMIVFLSIYLLVVLVTWRMGRLASFEVSPLDALLLAFATMRLGRMIAFDKICEPLRAPFTKVVPDRNGAGSIVVPRGTGAQRSIGELISCPTCVGTWVAAFFVYGLMIFPAPTRIMIIAIGVIGMAEMLHSATEALCWSGIYSRAKAGAQMTATQKKNLDAEDQEPV